jgi:hypothetical protein
MDFEKMAYSLKDLVDAWNSGSMVRNPEYQRGEAWTLPQKQALVDSLLAISIQYRIETAGLRRSRMEDSCANPATGRDGPS